MQLTHTDENCTERAVPQPRHPVSDAPVWTSLKLILHSHCFKYQRHTINRFDKDLLPKYDKYPHESMKCINHPCPGLKDGCVKLPLGLPHRKAMVCMQKMYVLEWRTVYAPVRGVFFFIPSCAATREINTKIRLQWVHNQMHRSRYICVREHWFMKWTLVHEMACRLTDVKSTHGFQSKDNSFI